MQTYDRKSLSVQLALSLVGLALLTTLIAGLPAIWLIRNHIESQEWAQVDQAVQTTKALYAAREHEVDTLATLTAQRPSLRLLLQKADLKTLTAYLDTLRQGADLDWVAVCDPKDTLIAQVAEETDGVPQPSPCHLPQVRLITTNSQSGKALTIWMIAAEFVEAEGEQVLGKVIVGKDSQQRLPNRCGRKQDLITHCLPTTFQW